MTNETTPTPATPRAEPALSSEGTVTLASALAVKYGVAVSGKDTSCGLLLTFTKGGGPGRSALVPEGATAGALADLVATVARATAAKADTALAAKNARLVRP